MRISLANLNTIEIFNISSSFLSQARKEKYPLLNSRISIEEFSAWKETTEDYAFWSQKYNYMCNSKRGDSQPLVIFSNESFDKGEFILL